MALEDSILKSTKKILGLDGPNAPFDLDVITHINTCFLTLNQLGIGPAEGFMIEDDGATWGDFTGGVLNLNAVKTYVYLKVRSFFDPPESPHHMAALNEQITELEHRIKMERELARWQPSSSVSLP